VTVAFIYLLAVCLLCSREIVPLSSIEHVQKKRRHDKEARLETVLVSSFLFVAACLGSFHSICNIFIL